MATRSRSLRSPAQLVAVTMVGAALFVAPALTAAVPLAVAASATDQEVTSYLKAAGGAIAELEAARGFLAKDDFAQAGQAVSAFYFRFYDPKLEGPSRSLKPREGSTMLRKPEMESYKSQASNAIRDKDRARAESKINLLRDGVARDVMILVGGVSDEASEKIKQAAAAEFLAVLMKTHNAGTAASKAAAVADHDSGTGQRMTFPSVPISLASQTPQRQTQPDESSSAFLPTVLMVASVLAIVGGIIAAMHTAPGPGGLPTLMPPAP